VSDDMRDRIAPLAPDKLPIQTIHAGKNPEEYAFSTKHVRGVDFVSVGRLSEKKGHDDAIRVLAEVRRLGLDAKLTIIGAGPMKQQLEDIARQLRVEKYVLLRGALNHDTTKELIIAADYLIMAS